MSQYQSDPTQRNNTYYQTYYDALQTTYTFLEEWDLPQILIPVEAPFYNSYGVDFLGQLTTFCQNNFNTTGSMCLGIMGTRTGLALTPTDITAMATDTRLQSQGNSGKFVSVFVGEGSVSFQELPTAYTASVVGPLASILATSNPKLSVINSPLPNITAPIGILTDSEISQLAEAQLNPISLTGIGRRGTVYQTVAYTDNTLGPVGTDYWSMSETKLVMIIIDQIHTLGKRSLGVVGYGSFRADCQNYLNALVNSGFLKSFTLNIGRDPQQINAIDVDISLSPYTSLRQLTFTVTVGPGT